MTYCSHCGTELTGRFCAKCGAPAPAPGAPQADVPQPPPAGPPLSSPSYPGLDENVASALCYLIPIVTGILFLFIDPYNRNKKIRFHAFQAIFFWIAVFVAEIAVDIVFGTILGGINSYELLHLVWTVFRLAVLALWLMLMYRAYKNERWVLPVAGEMAQKFA